MRRRTYPARTRPASMAICIRGKDGSNGRATPIHAQGGSAAVGESA
jgi:hypothetical protein